MTSRLLRLASTATLTAIAGSTATVAAAAPAYAADTIPPQVTVTVRDADLNGWHRVSSVPVSLQVKDTGSGVDHFSSVLRLTGAESGTVDLDSPVTQVAVATEGVTTLAWEVYDNEGNRRAGEIVVRLDHTAPSLAPATLPVRVAQGSVHDTSVGCTDTHSQVSLCVVEGGTRLDTSTPGPIVVDYTAQDLAGNVASARSSYTVIGRDKGPVVTLTPHGTLSSHGWYSTEVSVGVAVATSYDGQEVTGVNYLTSSPHSSGTLAPSVAQYRLAQKGTTRLEMTAVDSLGLAGPEAMVEVNIDPTPPVVDLPAVAPVEVGTVITLADRCDDLVSGLQSCRLSGAADPDTHRLDTSTPGVKTVTLTAKDLADNVATRTIQVTVLPDPEAPQVTATTTLSVPSVVASGGTVPVTVRVASSSPLSGGQLQLLDGATVVGTYPGQTSATFPVRLAPGRHVLVATYTQDGVQPSRSEPVTVLVKSPTTGTATYKVKPNGKAKALVRIVGRDALPSGLVQVFDGTRLIGTATLTSDGTVVVRLKKLAKGKHVLTTRYAGSDATDAVTTPKQKIRIR